MLPRCTEPQTLNLKIYGAESWTLDKDIANSWLILKDRF
jgi:hypothetical protein